MMEENGLITTCEWDTQGRWIVPILWPNKRVFIIGGGHSLDNFDWSPLRGEWIIGCNDAYKLGIWIDICIFGDDAWWDYHEAEDRVKAYTGLLVGCCPKQIKDPQVNWMERENVYPLVLERNGKLAWNSNTGAAAINLAILLGATEIVLLGYDMKLGPEGQSNWHPNYLDSPNETVFNKFTKGFERLACAIEEQCPSVTIYNAGPDSHLDYFPKVPLREIL